MTDWQDGERTVALVTTKTSFEAEVIAQALRARGVNARALATPQLPVGTMNAARVMVLESDESAARAAMEDVKAEASKVDWESAEFDDTEGRGARAVNRERRFVMTLGVLLVPVGLGVLMYGTMYTNPMVRIVGGAVLACALIMIGKSVFSKDE